MEMKEYMEWNGDRKGMIGDEQWWKKMMKQYGIIRKKQKNHKAQKRSEQPNQKIEKDS